MSAKEMFKELGYKQVRNDSCLIKYEQFINGNCTQITFTLLLKKVIATYGYQTSGSYAHDITSDEFRAIVQQEKELGWLEDEKHTEINIEHYYDDLTKFGVSGFAVINKKVTSCAYTKCSQCVFNGECCGQNRLKWLASTFKKPTIKLTKFEIDLLQIYSQVYSPEYQFKNITFLSEMMKKGYFKDVDKDAKIEDILENCGVM